jgi:hypothetical protein
MTDTPPRRRRLWELPTQAHELLLAFSFTPEVLRREAARTLGQMHHGQCLLKGSDVDVLYSVVHDMDTRNPLSEAFQKRLDARHTLALQRLVPLREADAVRTAWQQALQADDMPGGLWALLTHPLGAELQGPALYDARGWVFAHGRRSVALAQAGRQAQGELQEAREQVDTLRLRLARQQQQAQAELAQARAELARLAGEVARLGSLPTWTPPKPREADVAPPALAAPHVALREPASAPIQLPSKAPVAQVPTAAPPAGMPVRGRRVLCVGGIRHAVPRYRSRVEGLGGHFEHHDGGVEDSVQALEGRLNRAELVICQAACINHEAYHRIKRHCERTGTPCVYLERPSLSRFDRALHELVFCAGPAHAGTIPQQD